MRVLVLFFIWILGTTFAHGIALRNRICSIMLYVIERVEKL